MLNGKDTAGNEITVQKKVVSLDLDKPNVPVINSNSGYAILTLYGATFDKATTIIYDTRTDIDNYYSIDNGVTWIVYTGQFDMVTGTVIAKSIKKNTGLEVSVSKTIAMPADAIPAQAYDGNANTATGVTGTYYMKVDSSMQGKNMRVKWNPDYYQGKISYLDVNKSVIRFDQETGSAVLDKIYNIPSNTKWISYSNGRLSKLYEIQTSNEPTFSATNGYMLFTADSTKSIKEPYQNITVNYFPMSAQRLYRIGTTGDWLNYEDQPIKVNVGKTIYAKGIDIYGNETIVVSSLTANVVDAIPKAVIDSDDNTYFGPSDTKTYYMEVDSSMQGKNMRVKWNSDFFQGKISYLDVNKSVIRFDQEGGSAVLDKIYNIPSNTKWISYMDGRLSQLYEIQAKP